MYSVIVSTTSHIQFMQNLFYYDWQLFLIRQLIIIVPWKIQGNDEHT